jgi:hypothetical protein
MKKLIRTTISIPEDIYKQAKVKASILGESFSAYVVDSLQEKASQIRNKGTTKVIDPVKTLGVFSVGIKKVPERNKLYEKYLKTKLGL